MFNVSVIVPVYNAEAYLEACLASLAAQTLEHIEIIVVIDASPDASDEIVGAFCNRFPERFRKIVLTENQGVSKARNIGIRSAQGEYIGFVDSDDIVEPRMYEVLFKQALEDDSDVVSCKMRHFEQDPSINSQSLSTEAHYQDTFVTNKLFRRAFISGRNIHFYPDVIFEDEAFVYTSRLSTDKITAVNQELYNYRLSPQGLCRSEHRGQFNLYDKQVMLVQFLADINRRGLIEAHASMLLQCLANHALSALYYKISPTDLVGFFSFIDHLVAKYHLEERSLHAEADYRVSRYLKFRGSSLRIILLSGWVKLRQLTTPSTHVIANPVAAVGGHEQCV